MVTDYMTEMDGLLEGYGKIEVDSVVRYKILDRDDDDYQGLFKNAKAVILHRKGMTLHMKHRIKTDEPMLVELELDDSRIIKACCESINCVNSGDHYEVDVEFIIIKDNDKQMIDSYVNDRSN